MITLLVILLVVNGGVPGISKTVDEEGGQLNHVPIVLSLPANLTMSPELHPEFVPQGDRVQLHLTGEVFDPPLEMPRPPIQDMTTPEKSVMTIQGVMSLGDLQSVQNLYAEQERRSVSAMLDDRTTRSQLYLKPEASPRLKIHATAYYGPYAIVLARYGPEPTDAVAIPLIYEAGRWMRTNALLGDAVYDHALKSFVLGGFGGGDAAAQPVDLPPIIPMVP